MLQMVLVCCSQPLGGCIHPPAIAGLTAPTYNLVQRLASGQLRSSQNLRAALTHSGLKQDLEDQLPLHQGRLNLWCSSCSRVPRGLEATTCHGLFMSHPTSCTCLTSFSQEHSLREPVNCTNSLGSASGEHGLKYKMIPGSD